MTGRYSTMCGATAGLSSSASSLLLDCCARSPDRGTREGNAPALTTDFAWHGRETETQPGQTVLQPDALLGKPAVALRVEIALVAVVVLALTGCGKPNPANRPERPSEVTKFGDLYNRHCAGCHGAEGKLGPAPPLNDALFLAIVTDEDLSGVITSGRKGTLMPAFSRQHGGPLTPQQVAALVAGLRKNEKWSTPAVEHQQPLPAYSLSSAQGAGAATANLENGAMVFAKACAQCHGTEGQGGPKAGALNDQAFLQLVSDQLLRRIVITGRPDMEMPSFRRDLDLPNFRHISAEPLSPQEITDVVAYVAAWRTAPDRRPIAALQHPENTTVSASP